MEAAARSWCYVGLTKISSALSTFQFGQPPAASLFHAPRLPYTYGLLNCFPPMHGKRLPMAGIPGSPPDLRDLPSGCAFHPRCAWAMPRCRQEAPVLAPLAKDADIGVRQEALRAVGTINGDPKTAPVTFFRIRRGARNDTGLTNTQGALVSAVITPSPELIAHSR